MEEEEGGVKEGEKGVRRGHGGGGEEEGEEDG